MAPVADAFLIPDNHIGRATVSSVAVAHEVQAMGGRAIACLNARDRNLLGFQRDLLTATAYGVHELLFVYGDKPSAGGRTSELTVRTMMEEARAATTQANFAHHGPFRIGVASSLKSMPAWKREADYVFAQICFSVESLLRWRDSMQLDMAVYAGVLVVPSRRMADRLGATIPDIQIPPSLLAVLDQDRDAGAELAVQTIIDIRDSGAFDGVHLVSVGRYPKVTDLLIQEGFKFRGEP